nr:hypothetical protein [Lysobacter enzymogenes]
MSREPLTPPRWYVISLRPSDDNEAIRCIAAQYGSALIELSPWTIRSENTAVARAALASALQSAHVLVTSPNAARALRDLCAADARAPRRRCRNRRNATARRGTRSVPARHKPWPNPASLVCVGPSAWTAKACSPCPACSVSMPAKRWAC